VKAISDGQEQLETLIRYAEKTSKTLLNVKLATVLRELQERRKISILLESMACPHCGLKLADHDEYLRLIYKSDTSSGKHE
jgi:hypothetical protein